jgi:hypothetical protein
MGAELGRISGPLLADNLLRNGINLSVEDSLLYIDVNNGLVGFKTATPGFPLDVNGTTDSTNLIVDTWFTVPNFYIANNTIQNTSGTIYIHPDSTGATPSIVAPAVRTDKLKVSNQLIENIITNDNIELSPTGIVIFNSNRVNVNGSLHATGNVTYDGNVIFGDANTDGVTFNADITSNITPDVSNTYDLGSLTKRWNNVYSPVISTSNIVTSSLTIGGIDLLLTPGKTIYVTTNGNDSNYGTHAHSTFATLKQALSVATSGDTIIIFPGTYTEIFPLTVPQGVTIKGYGIRAVKIRPTNETKANDAFLLNGDTSIEFLTVADFFFNSLTNTGYAFRFANGFKTIGRSPYIQNVTVKTAGSITSVSDPYGFDSADAGAGAYIDGSVADASGTIPPTMLFFSATFITPNQDAVTALNGVRVEWLNSFSYFARRGIYLKNGTLGRASQGVIYGAEMRSISSANVYGTYGAVADGADTLAYLIGHNFGYIGSGKDSSNDPLLVVQAQEIEKYNNGVIYFETTDHKGDVRVGEIFYVNQETGQIAFDAQSINVLAGGNITLESPTSTTIIDSLGIQTGNIRIYDNNIISLSGPVNIKANYGANTTYLNTNVGVTGTLTTTGDVTIYGNTYFGDSMFDRISINAYLTQDINPNVTNSLYLGSDSKRWNTLFNKLLDVDGVIQISNNTVTTLTTNTDLRFTAAGSGNIHVTTSSIKIDNNLTVTNNLTVNGTSDVKDLTIVGTTTLTGDLNQTGNTYITGRFSNNNMRIVGDSYFQVPDIRIYNNIISNQNVGNDLIFTANGTAGVKVENLTFTDSTITNTWISPSTNAQRNIILSPNGTGNVVINSTKSLKIPAGNNTNRTITNIGNIRYNNSYNRYEGYVPNGLISFNQLYSSDSSNSFYITNDTRFTATVQSIAAIVDTYTITVLDPAGLVVGYKVVSGPGLTPGARITNITGNVITLDLPNTSSSTGFIVFGDSTLSFSIISGLQAGQSVSGTGIQPGTIVVSYTLNSVLLSKPISALILSGSAITFGAVGTTFITPELTPGAADNTIRFGINSTVKATLTSSAFSTNSWYISNVSITGNVISNLVSNDLYLLPDSGLTNINNVTFDQSHIINNTNDAITITATGQGYVKITGKGAVVFPYGSSSERRPTPELGETRFNTEIGYLEVYNSTDWIPALGTSGAASLETVEETMNLWSLILG